MSIACDLKYVALRVQGMKRNAVCYFLFQAEDGIRYRNVTGVQTCALPIWRVEKFVPLFLWRRNTEGFWNELVPRIQIVAAFSADRASEHVQQSQGTRRLPAAEVAGCAAPPEVRSEASAGTSNLEGNVHDRVRLHSTFLFGEFRSEAGLMLLQSL